MTGTPIALAVAVLIGMTAACSASASGPSSAPRTPAPASSSTGSPPSSASRDLASSSPTSPTTPAPSAASASATGVAPVIGRPVTITIASGGDLIPHPAVLTTGQRLAGGHGFDFRPMFADIKPVLSRADLAICQMETPLSVNAQEIVWSAPQTAPRFTAPPQFATAAKDAGYAGCSTANNHAYDNGPGGLAQTRTVMQQAGLQDAGPAAQTGDRVAWYEVKGVKVAQLSYSWTLSNTIGDQTYAPAAAPWLAHNLYSVIGVEGILKDARAAREAGADFVVVSMHWGIEQRRALSPDQLEFGPALLQSGLVDFIIGNHPHVVQQCGKVDGRYVIYSEGNQLSQQGPPYFEPMAQDGVITTVTLSRDAAGSVSEKLSFQPTWVDPSGNFTIRLATPTTNPASYQRTVAAVKGDGTCDATPDR